MKILNEMKLLVTSKSVNERFARSAVSSFLIQIDPTVAELNEIRTAVSEAVTNCVVHAYRGTFGVIEIVVKIYEDGTVYIRIKDKGCGIADISKAVEPMYTSAPEEERSGLGFTVMQSSMDKVLIKSKPGQGTVVTMSKKIKDNKRISD
jgi:stage II sporulation protein AB (anti-sigma F factor)